VGTTDFKQEGSALKAVISVVTPFYNTESYLEQCIESVLAQTYPRFEYILVDNCSTDNSGVIAEKYAKRDARIRLIRRDQLLSQVQNYNRALMEISADSLYCKVVQADDYLFPQCLEAMAKAMEQSSSIGLVSSYWLKGDTLRGSGFPHDVSMLCGKEMASKFLRTGVWVFGSPTAVMYRSTIVREQESFYDDRRLHEDTEKCMEILKTWDFGFVPQVLSFSRADNEGISSAARAFQPVEIDRYILVQRWASEFLAKDEAVALKKDAKRRYYGVLASGALQFREHAFWQYHLDGLKTIGEVLDSCYLTRQVGRQLVFMTVNPGRVLVSGLRFLKRKVSRNRMIRRGFALLRDGRDLCRTAVRKGSRVA
jgi:glycosyltransferase involved in cell wall biosynthesis